MANQAIFDQDGFEKPMSRANFHSLNPSFMTISREEHARLLQISHEYDCLRNALLKTGNISDFQLGLMIKGEEGYLDTAGPANSGVAFDSSNPTAGVSAFDIVGQPSSSIHYNSLSSAGGSGSYRVPPLPKPAPNLAPPHRTPKQRRQKHKASPFFSKKTSLTKSKSSYGDRKGSSGSWGRPIRRKGSGQHLEVSNSDDDFSIGWTDIPSHSKSDRKKHTVLLSNLPYGVTHRDITEKMRGGLLVDIWMRRSERTATVTFFEGASEFVAYCKREGLYIKSKKVKVGWSRRQYTIKKGLEKNIIRGATRNFIIRNCANWLTEKKIREHNSHIHNSVFVSIDFIGADIRVKTNSLNIAFFAVTNLRSRREYKGLRIESCPDECNVTLPQTPVFHHTPAWSQAPQPPPHPVNRFDLLNLQNMNSETEEDDDASSGISGVNINRRSRGSTVFE